MRTKKRAKGWMVIKIDLEKAYDKLNWCFIRETLEDIGLPQNFITMVWHCISSPKMRMLWNREALTNSLALEELDKVIQSHLTYLFCAY